MPRKVWLGIWIPPRQEFRNLEIPGSGQITHSSKPILREKVIYI